MNNLIEHIPKQKGDKDPVKSHHNVLVKALKNFKAERIPMAERNIYNIIENAMEEKYKYDISKLFKKYINNY